MIGEQDGNIDTSSSPAANSVNLLVQTVILLPLMVAPVIAAIMIRWMFNDQFGIDEGARDRAYFRKVLDEEGPVVLEVIKGLNIEPQ